VDVLLEHVKNEALPVWIRAACAEEIEARVLDLDAVTVILSGDFVRSVIPRRIGPDDEYTTERTFGETIAKTMPSDDGITILFNVPLVREQRVPESYMRRMAGHEAYHAVIHERGETSHAIRERHRLGAYTERGTFGELATYTERNYVKFCALHREGLDQYLAARLSATPTWGCTRCGSPKSQPDMLLAQRRVAHPQMSDLRS
jgi:hypothetical protein